MKPVAARSYVEERPIKRHKGSIHYYLEEPKEADNKDEIGTNISPSTKNVSPQQQWLPTRTPIAGLVTNRADGGGNNNNNKKQNIDERLLASSLIHSLQRRFISQQVLETPLTTGRHSTIDGGDCLATDDDQGADLVDMAVIETCTTNNNNDNPSSNNNIIKSDDSDLEGFVLHSQPAYERILSQRCADEDHNEGDIACEKISPISIQGIRFNNISAVRPAEALRIQDSAMIDNFTSNTLGNDNNNNNNDSKRNNASAKNDMIKDRINSDEIGNQLIPPATEHRPRPLTMVEPHKLTPAVHSVDRVQLNSNAACSFFPIFRSKRDCKVVYIIRHGESEFNAAIAAAGSQWADPLIYDAPLTARGKQQARNLRKQTATWKLPSDAVWVSSPLTRAIQTMLLVHPHIDTREQPLEDGHGTTFHVTPKSEMQRDCLQRICILPEISERLVTSGDIGRKPADLCRHFPALEHQFAKLPEVWWHTCDQKPNCPYRGEFNSSETKDAMQRRVAGFRKWLLEREEKVFVAVGHSVFWKAFATSCHNGIRQESLKNCAWQVLHV